MPMKFQAPVPPSDVPRAKAQLSPELIDAMTQEPLVKPKGLHCRYVFTTGKHLNIFGVTDINLDGEAYRVTDHTGSLFIIQKELVLYCQQKVVA